MNLDKQVESIGLLCDDFIELTDSINTMAKENEDGKANELIGSMSQESLVLQQLISQRWANVLIVRPSFTSGVLSKQGKVLTMYAMIHTRTHGKCSATLELDGTLYTMTTKSGGIPVVKFEDKDGNTTNLDMQAVYAFLQANAYGLWSLH